MGNGTNKENIEDRESFIVESEPYCRAKDTKFRYKKETIMYASKFERIKQYHQQIGNPILRACEWIHIFSAFGIMFPNEYNEGEKSHLCESLLAGRVLPGQGGSFIGADPVQRMCFHPACSVESTGMRVLQSLLQRYLALAGTWGNMLSLSNHRQQGACGQCWGWCL